MKKTTIKLIALFALIIIAVCVKAQNNGIVYTQFNPNWCLESVQYQPANSIHLDLDGDGLIDFAISMHYHRYIVISQIPFNGLEYRTKLDYDETDTLVSTAPIGWETRPVASTSNATHMVGIRKIVNDTTIYYGWFNEMFSDSTVYGSNPVIKEWLCVSDMAFCTIPNYPLKWGQTSLMGVDESGTVGFAGVVPNPTTGIFTVTGENLNQIEVIDLLGQRITSLTANNDQTTIDLSGQPAGIYLVNVIDLEGKHCVKKVVKQ